MTNPAPPDNPGAPPKATPIMRRNRVWVSVAYAVQGLGFAVILTNLPGISNRASIGESDVSFVMLVAVLLAGVGSMVAGTWAARRGSASVLAPAFTVQAVALVLAMADLPFPMLFPVFALFGLGLGLADAGNGMQAITVQRRYGKSIINLFFGFQTVAAITGALLVAAVNGLHLPFEVSFAIAAAVAVTLAPFMRKRLAADPEASAPALQAGSNPVDAIRLPWRGIIVFGMVIAVAYVGESAVGTWSSIYLKDILTASAFVVPLGYAAYQALVLLSRLVGDRLVRQVGRARILAVATVVAAGGLAIAGAAPTPSVAVLGFGLTGLGLGVLVPLSFAAAGDLAPTHTDEVVARLNLFNYVGVLVGSAATGFIAEQIGLRLAFVIPAVLILSALFAVRAYRVSLPASE